MKFVLSYTVTYNLSLIVTTYFASAPTNIAQRDSEKV